MNDVTGILDRLKKIVCKYINGIYILTDLTVGLNEKHAVCLKRQNLWHYVELPVKSRQTSSIVTRVALHLKIYKYLKIYITAL